MSPRDEERDELFNLWLKHGTSFESDSSEGKELAEAILAAGYRKHRTISTVEELDALGVDSVVLSAAGLAYQCNSDGEIKWWAHPGEQRIFASRKLSLPATVLHEGGAA